MTFIKVFTRNHVDFTAEESIRISKRIKRLFSQEFSIDIGNVYVPLSESEKIILRQYIEKESNERGSPVGNCKGHKEDNRQ
jgi:hypothetical protein